ncbi:hypothetical protein Q0Z83_086130 [Actinoplanes sichuanensis]|uniref:Uncharacterized protein n=1 Tax=Actinoplanes sichuanensis TaxID=512349 RepID=A0ABW4ALS1_9ACTN|nr:hypothetical protein [Actinoplanes sichuanensis]BEL10422.1 hypothetical protein Q0Z83_086130 [Actinoplanes sichuanensis]
MTLIESELRAALRAEAAAHRPDREAMLDRITRAAMHNRTARNRPGPRLKITGAAVAVAAVLGGGGFAQWAVAGDDAPRPEPTPTVVISVSPTPSVAPSPSATGPTAKSSSRAPRSRPPSRSSSPSPSIGGPTTAQGALWSDGSVAPDGDSQASSVVTVTTSERLIALDVTIRLNRTDGLTARGGSQQVPGASVTSTVTEEPSAFVYRFVLSSGDTLEPGTYTFYARYTYPEGGRDAGGDGYAAAATTEGGAAPKVNGDFR